MVNEYFLKSPSQQRFYHVMAFLLSITAFNYNFWSFYKMPNNIMFKLARRFSKVAGYIGSSTQIIYLVINYSELDFNSMATIYTIFPVMFVVMVKIITALTLNYKKVMMEFIEQIHIFSYYCKNSQPYVKQVLLTTEMNSRWSLYILSPLCIVCTCAFLVVPIIHNYQNIESINNITSRLEIMVHFWVPMDYEYNFFNWLIMQAVCVYTAVLAVLMVVVFDSMSLAFLYHFIGHIKILKHFLKEEFSGTMTHEETKRKLIEVTRHFAFIKRILNDLENAYGFNMLGIYMHNLFSGGFLMFMIMTSGANTEILLTFGLMIPIYMGELIALSLVLENIRIHADDLPELVYNLCWENMSISNQKLVLILLAQVQPVLEFKAAFGVKTGMKPAINIIKTAFSYYVLIKSRM